MGTHLADPHGVNNDRFDRPVGSVVDVAAGAVPESGLAVQPTGVRVATVVADKVPAAHRAQQQPQQQQQ